MQRSRIHTSCIAHFNIHYFCWSSKPPSLPSIHRAVDFISQGAGCSFGPYNLSAPRKGLPVLAQQGTKDHPLPFPLKDPSNPEVYGNRNFLFVTPQQNNSGMFFGSSCLIVLWMQVVHNAQLCEVERGWSIYHDVGPNGHVAGHLEEHLRVKESNRSGREPTMIHMDLTVDHWVVHPSIVEDSSCYGRQISCLCPVSPLKTTVTTPHQDHFSYFPGHHTQPLKKSTKKRPRSDRLMTDLPLSSTPEKIAGAQAHSNWFRPCLWSWEVGWIHLLRYQERPSCQPIQEGFSPEVRFALDLLQGSNPCFPCFSQTWQNGPKGYSSKNVCKCKLLINHRP